jgi:hypothetical protein
MSWSVVEAGVWEGGIPVELALAEADVTALRQPQPIYVSPCGQGAMQVTVG